MIKYNVDREKGIVVAYFDGGKEYIENCIYYRMRKLTKYNYAIEKVIVREFAGLDDAYFVGKAKVNFDAGDKFDINIGEIMAHDRLLNKYHKLEKRITNRIIDVVKRECADIVERLERI